MGMGYVVGGYEIYSGRAEIMNLEARRVCYRASHLIVRIAEKSDYVENFNVSEEGKMTPMGLGEGGMETLSHIDSWC